MQGSQQYALSNSTSVQLGAGLALFKDKGSVSILYGTPVVGASALRNGVFSSATIEAVRKAVSGFECLELHVRL